MATHASSMITVRRLLIFSFVCLLVILWSPEPIVCKGGRGGGGRGSSGGRGSGRGSSSRGSSSRGSSSRGSSRSSYRGGSGYISSGKSRSIASGLVGAFVGYQAGKAVGKITSGSHSAYLPHYGRSYYFGSRFYGSPSSDKQTCKYIVDSNDEYFDMKYEDGNRMTEVIYECQSRETCCNGLDCCSPMSWWLVLIILSSVILSGLLFVYCCVKKCRSAENSKSNEIVYHTVLTQNTGSSMTSFYPPGPTSQVQTMGFSAPLPTNYMPTAQHPSPGPSQYQTTPLMTSTANTAFVPNYTLVGQETANAFSATSTNFNDRPPGYDKAVLDRQYNT